MTARRRRLSWGSRDTGGRPDHYESLDDDLDLEDEEPSPAPPRRTAPPSARVTDLLRRARQRNAGQDAQEGQGQGEEAEGIDRDEINPSTRQEQIRRRAPQFEREWRLKMVHRLLMRKVPLDEIAEQFGVSLSTIQRDRRDIYRIMGEQASRLDINSLLGQTMAYYDEAGAMALRIATGQKTSASHRLAALRTAMQSRKEMGQWLSAAGVFDQLKFIPDQDAQSGDLRRLLDMTEAIFSDRDFDGLSEFDEGTAELDDENIDLLL